MGAGGACQTAAGVKQLEYFGRAKTQVAMVLELLWAICSGGRGKWRNRVRSSFLRHLRIMPKIVAISFTGNPIAGIFVGKAQCGGLAVAVPCSG